MFAFALWDELKQFLLLARIASASNPYTTRTDKALLFASEISHFWQIHRWRAGSTLTRLTVFDLLLPPGNETLFRNL
jgi:asparagine synthetase B (glutamine-hydrolysing)